MSLKRTGLRTSPGGFSSVSMGSRSVSRISTDTGISQITPVTINKSLLTPLKIDIDPNVQAVRTSETEQIKTLNNRFVSFIDKVRILEQENKMLDTKWKLLQDQTESHSNIEPMLKAYITNLQRQLDSIKNDKQKLDLENDITHKHVEEYKTKYEQEINKRNDAENDFVMLKKDVDSGYLDKVNLDESVTSLADELKFLKALYDTELSEMQESLKDTSVVVQMNNSRELNMDNIVAGVKAQYEEIAARSREEAERTYKTKFEQMTAEADESENDLRNSKNEIAELNRMISRLQNELEAAKGQRAKLEGQVADAEKQGEDAVNDAKLQIKDLEVAVQRAKQDMARQLRQYQELMNVKLALDIEISTYRKLLEGEEARVGQESVLKVQTVPIKAISITHTNQRRRSGPILIKTVETQDTLVSENIAA